MTSNPSASSENNDQKREHLFKVLVIGELATGKTAVVKRYVNNFFSEHYRSTIGVDFALKLVKYDDDNVIRLQLWDIAGQERFGNMTRVYYKEAVGCLVVFDVTRASTFEAVTKWKTDLDNKIQLPNGSRLPCVLLANKCDLVNDGFDGNNEQMDQFCQEKGFAKWFETSAKENINIETSIQYLISEIMKHINDLESPPSDKKDVVYPNDVVNPNDMEQKPSSKGNCCGGKS